MIPQDRLYQPGLAILNLWPQPNTTGLNYNYEVELPTVNTLIQQPAVRLDYQPRRTGASPASTPGRCAATK